MGVDPSTILSELPISTSFGVIKVLWYALHNIPSHWNLISTGQLEKNQSLIYFFSLDLLCHYWFFLSICKWQLNEICFCWHCHNNVLFNILLKYSSQYSKFIVFFCWTLSIHFFKMHISATFHHSVVVVTFWKSNFDISFRVISLLSLKTQIQTTQPCLSFPCPQTKFNWVSQVY